MNIEQLKQKTKRNITKSIYDLNFEISTMVSFGRIKQGLSQKQLAKKVKTQQPSIARIESGKLLPSLTFLEKIAKALKCYVEVRFVPIQNAYIGRIKQNTGSAIHSILSPYPLQNYTNENVSTSEYKYSI